MTPITDLEELLAAAREVVNTNRGWHKVSEHLAAIDRLDAALKPVEREAAERAEATINYRLRRGVTV